MVKMMNNIVVEDHSKDTLENGSDQIVGGQQSSNKMKLEVGSWKFQLGTSKAARAVLIFYHYLHDEHEKCLASLPT